MSDTLVHQAVEQFKTGKETHDLSHFADSVGQIRAEADPDNKKDLIAMNKALVDQGLLSDVSLTNLRFVGETGDKHLIAIDTKQQKLEVLDAQLTPIPAETAALESTIAAGHGGQPAAPATLPDHIDTPSGTTKFTYDSKDATKVTKLEQPDGAHYDLSADGNYQKYGKDNAKQGDPQKLDIRVDTKGDYKISDPTQKTAELHLASGSTITLDAGSKPTDIEPPGWNGWHFKLDGDTYHLLHNDGKPINQENYAVEYQTSSGNYKVTDAVSKESTLFNSDGSQVAYDAQGKVAVVTYPDTSKREFQRSDDGTIQFVRETNAQGDATQWKVEDGKLVQYTTGEPPGKTGQSLDGKPVVDDKTGSYQVVGKDGGILLTYNTDGSGADAPAPAPATDPKPEVWGPNGRQYTPLPDGTYEYHARERQPDGSHDSLWWIAKDSLRHFNGKEPTNAEVLAQVHQIAKDNGKEGPGIDPREINRLQPRDRLIIRPPQQGQDAAAPPAGQARAVRQDTPAPQAGTSDAHARPSRAAVAPPDGPHPNADKSTTVYKGGHPIEVLYPDGKKATFQYAENGTLFSIMLPDGSGFRHFVLDPTDRLFHEKKGDRDEGNKIQIEVDADGTLKLTKGSRVNIIKTDGAVESLAPTQT